MTAVDFSKLIKEPSRACFSMILMLQFIKMSVYSITLGHLSLITFNVNFVSVVERTLKETKTAENNAL